ncbi:MAG: ABC transporter ATP-binding protein [archaeon]
MSKIEEKVNLKDNFGYYLKLAAPYWKTFVIVLVILSIVALVEVGQNLVYKQVIDDATLFTSGGMIGEAFVQSLLFLGAIFLGSVIVLSITKFFRVYLLNVLETKIMLDVKMDIFSHLLNLSHSFHTTHRTGSLISKLIRSSKSVEGITDFITFHGSPLVLKVILSFAVIALFDLPSAMVVLGTVVAFIIYSWIVLGWQQKANIERNEAEDFEKGFISDIFINIETVKHFGKEKRIIYIFRSIAQTTLKKFLKFWNFYALMESGMAFILGLGTILIMYFSLTRMLNGELTVGSLAFIYASFLGLIAPLFEFMWGVRRLYESLSDLEAIVQYKKTVAEVVDRPGAKPLKISKGSVDFEDVTFSYGRSGVVKDFSLKVMPKDKVAFVGHSGAGKTTIVKLLYRLYDVDKGKIKIDGNDIADFTQESLRGELSIVPQECVLFNDTIYNNVLFSNPDATRQKVFAALKAAQLYDFVKALPEQEKTVVGERGIKLSGGEKQRLSIARAILADKKILVLDEATSALDSTTEYLIQRALSKLMEGRTTLMIAHRLSTIMKADKIVVMEKGKIMQVGTHAELADKKGIYQKLWKLQKDGELVE